MIESDQIEKRSEEYIKELYNDNLEIVCETNDGPEIPKEDIRKAMTGMSNSKAIGTDGIAKAMVEVLGERGVDILTDIARNITEME